MCPNIKEKNFFGLSTLSTDKAQCLLTWPLKNMLRQLRIGWEWNRGSYTKVTNLRIVP